MQSCALHREARIIAGLNHPNICTLYDVGNQDGLDFIVMEYLAGETLETRFSKGPLSLQQALEYGSQIAHGLDKAHRNGITHRDLNPRISCLPSRGKAAGFRSGQGWHANGNGHNPDRGHSDIINDSARSILGSFPYMSPEQVQGKDLDVT